MYVKRARIFLVHSLWSRVALDAVAFVLVMDVENFPTTIKFFCISKYLGLAHSSFQLKEEKSKHFIFQMGYCFKQRPFVASYRNATLVHVVIRVQSFKWSVINGSLGHVGIMVFWMCDYIERKKRITSIRCGVFLLTHYLYIDETNGK